MARQAFCTLKISQVKRLFFDRPYVVRSLDAARLRFLARAGAFVRRSARSSIRKRKSISDPGKPPSSHVGSLRDKILFWMNNGSLRKTVKIGPAAMNIQYVDSKGKPRVGLVPEVLEFGGEIGRREVETSKGKWLETRGDRLPGWARFLPRRLVYVYVMPRPYMRPALRVNQSKFPGMWRDQFGKRG